jgi:hypothetical protein
MGKSGVVVPLGRNARYLRLTPLFDKQFANELDVVRVYAYLRISYKVVTLTEEEDSTRPKLKGRCFSCSFSVLI